MRFPGKSKENPARSRVLRKCRDFHHVTYKGISNHQKASQRDADYQLQRCSLRLAAGGRTAWVHRAFLAGTVRRRTSPGGVACLSCVCDAMCGNGRCSSSAKRLQVSRNMFANLPIVGEVRARRHPLTTELEEGRIGRARLRSGRTHALINPSSRVSRSPDVDRLRCLPQSAG